MKRYIVWSKRTLDLTNPWQRRWWIQQVLLHGRAEDVAALDWEEVRQILPSLELPPSVRRLWEEYFAYANQNASPKPDAQHCNADKLRAPGGT
jgi:hypothetical protein